MQPSDLTPPEAFTTADRSERIDSFFENADQKILTGLWECAPSREVIDACPVDEMMVILGGSVTVTDADADADADGDAQTFTAGDVFFIPKGTPCTWEITTQLRKFYMIAE